MGLRPAEVRVMTPDQTNLLIEGWNAAQAEAGGTVEAPSDAEYEALVAEYG